MSREAAARVIAEFGELVGVPDMQFDENDYIALSTDQRVGINVRYVEESDSLLIVTTVAELEDQFRHAIYEELLTANFLWEATGGASFSISPELTHALMQQVLEVAPPTAEQLSTELSKHVAMTIVWSERVQDMVRDAETSSNMDHESKLALHEQLV